MKRSQDAMTAVVYAYGCGDPSEGIEHALSERSLQRAMWDALVNADHRAERAIWEAARVDPEIDRLVVQIDAVSQQIVSLVTERKAARAKVRAKVDTPELDAKIAALADERRQARKALWPILSVWRKANKDTLAAIEKQRREQNKAIRQQSGLHWGNYNRVVDAFERGRKVAKKTGGRMRYSDPTRKEGVLTCQIQRGPSGLGCTLEEMMDGLIGQVQIGRVSPALGQMARGERRRAARTWLSFRADAAGNRIRLPVTIHRWPPPGARIKSAQLTWRPEGEHLRWQLALTLVSPLEVVEHASPRAVGVDVGWRLMPDQSLLVATTWDTDGTHQRYTLPPSWMAGMDQVERLTAHVDDETLELAAAWHARVDQLPDDLRMPLMAWRPNLGARHVDCQSLHDAIRARLVAAPAGERVDLPDGFRHWYDRYRHLLVWRDQLRCKLIRQRRELYRLMGRDIAQAYSVVGVEEIDLAALARTKTREPEAGDNPLHQAARAQRQRAGVSELLQELNHQAAKAGAAVIEVNPRNTTLECHLCGAHSPQRDRAARIWTCPNGHVWDQDINAAKNILDAAIGASAPVEKAA